ncbi:uncharacterized protein LOC129741427 [Uranotaenia lowii]|uniref:uncharacterized protein LOC129741427 n=1 Tax=Uranotaenia lowii TaxID=190385 RepID=UPI00247A78BD|nr:uncharacterized protein LOC129741427 [Uranotaenia lowii]
MKKFRLIMSGKEVRCCVAACLRTSKDVAHMFQFPLDPEACEKWIEYTESAALREQFVLLGVEHLQKTKRMICANHFVESCFVDPDNKSQGLLEGSIPTKSVSDSLEPSKKRKTSAAPLDTEQTKPTNASDSCPKSRRLRNVLKVENTQLLRITDEFLEARASVRKAKRKQIQANEALQKVEHSIKNLKSKMKTFAETNKIKLKRLYDSSEDETLT